MKRIKYLFGITVLFMAFAVSGAEIHFLYGTPTGTPKTNNLIVREIYALSSNDTTKFADWVAYRLTHTKLQSKIQKLSCNYS